MLKLCVRGKDACSYQEVWASDCWLFTLKTGNEGEQPPLLVHLHGETGMRTCEVASLLHALELGVAAAARWIAVELLKDPTPPPLGDERVYGVGLALLPRDAYCLLQLLTDLRVDDLGDIRYDSRQWNTAEMRDMNPARVVCASSEQALAVLIEHAAPWIAAALAKEIVEEPVESREELAP